ncbi:MAG: protein kinase [Acidobacteriota bacterium]
MAEPTNSRFQLSLGARFFLVIALIVILAVGVAVAVTTFLGNVIADRTVRETLERSSMVQSDFKDAAVERLGLTTSLIANDPEFAAYLSESAASGDIASTRDLLEDFATNQALTFAIALDPEGYVLAQAGSLPKFGDGLSQDPIFPRIAEEGYVAGIWVQREQLFYVASAPVLAGQLLQGFLLSGQAIEDSQAQNLRRINGTDVTFILASQGAAPAWVATSLDPEAADGLLAEVQQRPGMLAPATASDEAARTLEVKLGSRQYLALARPLEDAAERTIGAAINLASLEEQLAPFRRIAQILGAVGVAAILLSLLLSYMLPRRVLQPISQLSSAAKAAANGDYDQQIATDSTDEVGQLASAFSTLLSELREKRDMEIYVNELTRNLPDHEVGTSEVVPAASRDATLLGIELREYSKKAPAGSTDAGEALEVLTRDLRRIARTVGKHQGKVEAVLGHRLVATFEGPQRSQRALAAAADITSRETSPQAHESMAVALVTGSALAGTVTWDSRPEYTLAGLPVELLEGLLRVARVGTLLFSQSAFEELSSTFTQAGVKAQEHRSTVSSTPLFSVPVAAIASFGGTELSATLEMTQNETTGVVASTTLSGVGPGSVLGERFEVLSELGAGGMGVVYKARDRSLNELVALKMLKHDVFGNSERLERLKDELKMARKISHPNVLRTFDFGEADGFPFISMEYVRGITLKHLLDQSGRLPLSAGLRLARQLCRGLWAAHSQQVLHRDIKPENLIIEPNGNAKLMDFGIARPIQRATTTQTQPGTLIGTPFYLAPEQLEGQEPDERADIYACGVVFYEIFTGTLPYPSDGNVMDIIRRKMHDEPTAPSEHWPTVPHTLEQIIMRCLERNREKRFGNADTLLKELEILRA